MRPEGLAVVGYLTTSLNSKPISEMKHLNIYQFLNEYTYIWEGASLYIDIFTSKRISVLKYALLCSTYLTNNVYRRFLSS